MKLIFHAYQNEEDYWRLRAFLREITLQNHRRENNWHVSRLDYWWWFGNPDLEKIPPEESMFFWETEQSEIAAVLNLEERGQAFIQIHPDFKTIELQQEMIGTAEERLYSPTRENRLRLWVWLDSQDSSLQNILRQRGFQPVDRPGQKEVQHRRSLDDPLPESQPVAGYTIRPLRDGLELLERCYASGLGFHNDDIHYARDNRDHPGWYHHIQSAPLYRRDLDIVAVAADGSIGSFCTIWFDDVSRTAYFEPVATVPSHRKHGLARAVMIEGLHRLKRMGCKVAFVGGFSEAANALYFSVMGPEFDILEPWEKIMEKNTEYEEKP